MRARGGIGGGGDDCQGVRVEVQLELSASASAWVLVLVLVLAIGWTGGRDGWDCRCSAEEGRETAWTMVDGIATAGMEIVMKQRGTGAALVAWVGMGFAWVGDLVYVCRYVGRKVVCVCMWVNVDSIESMECNGV